MKKVIKETLIFIFIVVFMSLTFTFAIYFGNKHKEKETKIFFENGYKQACIDFYKGKIKYQLIDNEDGTREWKQIGNDKK